MTKQTWNGVVTLNRRLTVESEPEAIDAAIIKTIREMADAPGVQRIVQQQRRRSVMLPVHPEIPGSAALLVPVHQQHFPVVDRRQNVRHICRRNVLLSALDHVRNDYDFCIIDNGPAVDMVTLNVLAAADDVLIPIRPDEFSFSGLLDLVEQVQAVSDIPAL